MYRHSHASDPIYSSRDGGNPLHCELRQAIDCAPERMTRVLPVCEHISLKMFPGEGIFWEDAFWEEGRHLQKTLEISAPAGGRLAQGCRAGTEHFHDSLCPTGADLPLFITVRYQDSPVIPSETR
jgi:hypothetical protein